VKKCLTKGMPEYDKKVAKVIKVSLQFLQSRDSKNTRSKYVTNYYLYLFGCARSFALSVGAIVLSLQANKSKGKTINVTYTGIDSIGICIRPTCLQSILKTSSLVSDGLRLDSKRLQSIILLFLFALAFVLKTKLILNS